MSSRPPQHRFTDSFTPGETIQYDIVETLHESRSQYQEIAIHRLVGHGRTLILDGNIQSSEADEHLYHEALVQPAMLLAATPPKDVLILGGGEGATLREALLHASVESAVMVDLDRDVIEACRRHLPTFHRGSFDDARVSLEFDDASAAMARFERSGRRFDVIVSDVVDPNEAPAKHLFSREFFALCRRLLRDGGVLAAQIGPAFPRHFEAGARAIAAIEGEFADVRAGRVFVPVYLSPWGFSFASDHLAVDPSAIASRIRDRLATPPRSFDASDLPALLSLPLELRAEIAAARSAGLDKSARLER